MGISKLLVANRGEIAARVLRTARVKGIKTAVLRHSSEQEGPAHLIADEVVTIEGSTPVAAYLDIAQIVGAAQRIGADAVHPGYGFLSENAAFVAALEQAGSHIRGPHIRGYRPHGRQDPRPRLCRGARLSCGALGHRG